MADATPVDSAEEIPTDKSNIEERVFSLLDLLRPPAPSDLSRKRKVAANKPGNQRSVINLAKRRVPVNIAASQRQWIQRWEIYC